jgi:glycosyltransferase involved in cell wall biosynthesis
MNLEKITPLIITHNEEANLARVLNRLEWARQVLIVDSFSSDGTLAISARYPNVRVIQRAFDTFADQCNFGLSEIASEWVLSLDADYVCGDGLAAELAALMERSTVAGYAATFRYCVNGKPLRGSLYPPRTVLHRQGRAVYIQEGHAHRLVVDGAVGELHTMLDHDDRKTLDRWIHAQQRYARDEVCRLTMASTGQLRTVDRIRRTGWLAPLVMPAYCLIVKGLILDGTAGLNYTLQRTYAELLLALMLGDRRLRHRDVDDANVSRAESLPETG